MTRFATGIALALTVALAACATPPTPYQTVDEGRYGYSEEQIDAETWRVRFAGNSATDRAVVEDYVLYRAAEIATANGADGFIVLKEDIEKDVAYYGNTYQPFGAFHFGHGHHFSNFGYGIGYGAVRSDNRYTDHLRIRLFKEVAPEGLGPSYDARAILRVLGPKIVRPAPTDG